ncbi:TetR/AcrR family transcriptional regulator [Lachnospiraceae bacterium NSJ-143]|mgnify:FL=1|nr:TetR/AcrR family transcriptional regulator [Lachnospiraceae bacterium NSJ-143]
MDRRQQKTRKLIFDSLSGLLAEKSYSHISVQEIVDKANIGRSTFYAHFETKDDLLRELCTDLFNHVFSQSLNTENTHDFSKSGNNQYSAITHILYHLRDSQRDILGILTCESGELFLKFFKRYINDLYTDKILEGIKKENMRVPYKFLVNHITSSFINMIQWWIEGGLKESPEELTEYFKAVINPVVKCNNQF